MSTGIKSLFAQRMIPYGPAVTLGEVEEAEGRVGCRIPAPLREVYIVIGAGGIANAPQRLLRPSELAATKP